MVNNRMMGLIVFALIGVLFMAFYLNDKVGAQPTSLLVGQESSSSVGGQNRQ